eukprot:746834-Hanusia_phi.AAC.1
MGEKGQQQNEKGTRSDGTETGLAHQGSIKTYSSGTVVKVQCGSALTCVQFATGSLQCWGLKGNNETIPPSRIFSTFSLGSRHGCGIEQSTSRIYCWGLTEDQRTNAPLGTFISVSSGAGHNCAIMTNYSIICWGFNP